MVFLRVKISCFRAKAHPVLHYCVYIIKINISKLSTSKLCNKFFFLSEHILPIITFAFTLVHVSTDFSLIYGWELLIVKEEGDYGRISR